MSPTFRFFPGATPGRVPPRFAAGVNVPFCDTPPSSQKSSSTSSSTNEMSCGNSDSSGGGNSNRMMAKSKSAHHLIGSNDVYAEVVDTLRPTPAQRATQTGARTSRRNKPLTLWDPNCSTQQQQQHSFYTPTAEFPPHNSRSHSSGFSSGSGSSTGATPPPASVGATNVISSAAQVHDDDEALLDETLGSILTESELETAPWFQSGMPRDLALEVLLREPDGAFLVRESLSRSPSGLALSVRVPLDFHPGGIAHYLIVRAPKGFRIKVRTSFCLYIKNYGLTASLYFSRAVLSNFPRSRRCWSTTR